MLIFANSEGKIQTPKIHIRDFMHTVNHIFHVERSVKEVVKTLSKNKIVGGSVIDANKKLVGFITEQDCIKQMLNNTYYGNSHNVAGDIMRKNPLSVSPDYDVLHLAEDMIKKRWAILKRLKDESSFSHYI
ncbi:MAG: putative transcriptional regulator [Oleiphilaceae bacterium]|jgi:predicted transcriptional regulator